ncbi:MAG: 30S ribosomal protein S16 [Alphaproteobacteria bacterium]|nr:30S ribosomal protein S16 [Alphaproteobacteria bacterium]
MAVRIRLSRGGSKKRPFYRIVAADSRAPRDGRFIEKLGTYNPMLPQDHESRVVVNAERVQYWLGIGAQPTDRLVKIFANLGLTKAPVLHEQPKKSAPKAKAVERMKAKEEAAKAAAEAAAEAARAAEEAAKAAAEAAAAPAEEAPAENSEAHAE